jgi:hypothetical protein
LDFGSRSQLTACSRAEAILELDVKMKINELEDGWIII